MADVVTAYVNHIRGIKTAKSAQTDIYYLRDVFGPICDALRITSRKLNRPTARSGRPSQDRTAASRRRSSSRVVLSQSRPPTSPLLSSARMQSRGLAPKTVNRYREILTRLFNWAMTQHGIRMPGDKNPAAAVERYTRASAGHPLPDPHADRGAARRSG